jgi:hypothetical protein
LTFFDDTMSTSYCRLFGLCSAPSWGACHRDRVSYLKFAYLGRLRCRLDFVPNQPTIDQKGTRRSSSVDLLLAGSACAELECGLSTWGSSRPHDGSMQLADLAARPTVLMNSAVLDAADYSRNLWSRMPSVITDKGLPGSCLMV